MSAIDLLVLGLVSEKPRHGYEINREIGSRGLRSWTKVSGVAVYKACARMERQGFLVSLAEKEGKSPERFVYQITPAGRDHLCDLVFEFMSSDEPIRNEFHLSLEFIESLDSNEAQLALEKRMENISRLLAGRKARLELLIGVSSEVAASSCRREVEMYQSELSWLEGLAAIVREGRLPGSA